MARDETTHALDSAIKGETMLVLIAHTPVNLTPKAKVGDTLSEQLVRAANVMCVRQFKNNIEARVKSKGAMTANDIAKAWEAYQPDVSVDSLLEEAALRVGLNILGKSAKDVNAETRSAIVAKVLANTKHKGAILTMISTLVEESKVEKPKGEKAAALDLSSL